MLFHHGRWGIDKESEMNAKWDGCKLSHFFLEYRYD